MNDFIEQIIKNLKSNGFPEKKVSLPTEKMYELADSRGLNFNQVLDQLKVKQNISASIETERIIFKQDVQTDNTDMFAQAQEMLRQMSPEQIAQYQKMFENMSDREKEEILKKGQDLGII